MAAEYDPDIRVRDYFIDSRFRHRYSNIERLPDCRVNPGCPHMDSRYADILLYVPLSRSKALLDLQTEYPILILSCMCGMNAVLYIPFDFTDFFS